MKQIQQKIEDVQPKFEDIEHTASVLYDQNVQYNQSTYTYNQADIAYGGVYNPNT